MMGTAAGGMMLAFHTRRGAEARFQQESDAGCVGLPIMANK